MKKFNIGFIVFVMFVFISSMAMASIGPATFGITPDTPFFGAFVDDSPQDLYKIHCDVKKAMKKVEGTKRWTANWQPDGTLPVHIDGGCTNYAVAVREALLETGYRWDQIKYARCSIFDTEKPDHVADLVILDGGEQWIMDVCQEWVMRPREFPQELTVAGIRAGKVPYIWWAQAEGKWVRTKFWAGEHDRKNVGSDNAKT